ncbi:hypothetical protein SBA2_450148 [Acidobacteriia bacterium SbA2]|nr:hypothetical protein SBA2_450148 [Acidobacteriia bacterium SbA2]
MGHNLSALWACGTSSEKHFADGDRLRLTPMARRPRIASPSIPSTPEGSNHMWPRPSQVGL